MFERGRAICRSAICSILAAVLMIATPGLLLSGPEAFAQEDASPEAEASPQALSPEESRFARLGGLIDDVIAEYGAPDWTDEGLAGYNAIELGGVGTITMVYFDAQQRVRSYLLVYLERPDELEEEEAIAAVVADVAPRDGQCSSDPVAESNLGDTVFVCQSGALDGVFSADDLLAYDLVGDGDGAYTFTVDPTDDAFFEIAVRPGVDGLPEPPTPEPTPSPAPPPPLDDRYPPIEDAGALIDGSLEAGTSVSLSGTVLEVRPAVMGTTIVMEALGEDGSSVIIAAENHDDLVGVFPGEVWNIFGVYAGYECGESGCVATVYVMDMS